MGVLWQADKLKQKERKRMKYFTPLQIAALAVLTVIVIALAIVAFATGKSLATDPVEIPMPTATPEVVKIELAGDTNTPTPVPIPAPTPTASPSDSPVASTKPVSTKQSDTFCILTIGNTDIPVRYGVDEKTLEKSPGYLPSSAMPGTEGTCAIYGHRNRNHFKVLKGAEVGDSIEVTMADRAVYTYAITDITIYESTSDWTLPATEGKTLVLVTCYPFQYSGHAPGKCVVTAEMY